ncbi:MAG: PorT family protein [Reichenbachiella sp.]
MKKYLLTTFLIALSYFSIAQPRIGLMVAPSLSYGRVKYPTDTIKNNGSTLLFKFGLEFDFMMSDNYAFSTGLLYSPERLAIKAIDASSGSFVEEYRVQYLQIPATLKLFTNEVAQDLKVYFQIGFLGEILLNSEPTETDFTLINGFKFYDFSFTGGAGVEYGAGVNSIIYGGIFYEHGLVNVINGYETNDEIISRLSNFNFKVGLKF